MLLLDILYYYLTFCGFCLLAVSLVLTVQVYEQVKRSNRTKSRRRKRKVTVGPSDYGRMKTAYVTVC